jgi:urea transport system substrate-binding protein
MRHRHHARLIHDPSDEPRSITVAGSLKRRDFLKSTLIAAAAGTSLAACSRPGAEKTGAGSNGGPVRMGMILDQTGPLNIYGLPMVDAVNFAVKEINAKGGVLGRPLEMTLRDAQSLNDKDVEFANELLLQKNVDVLIGGIASSAREAMRPVADRAAKPYIYPALYEGGVCDKNVFIRGLTPSQQLKDVLVPYCLKTFGPNMYILAADYNYGQISAQWATRYVQDAGGKVAGRDFIPLDATDFGPIVNSLNNAKPDFIMSFLVGGSHLNFYRQFAASGLKSSIPIASTTFGIGNDHVALSPSEGEGIVVALDYFQELDTPVNKDFVDRWHGEYGAAYPYISDYVVIAYDSVHMWAQAVQQAGTTDRDPVIAALEKITYQSPAGELRSSAGSHHFDMPVHLAKVNNSHGFEILQTFPNVSPAYEVQVCNLITDSTTNKQFVPS